jgi:hypothetical protein
MILPQRRSDQRELKERLHVFAISATTSAQILKASRER